MFHLLDRAFDDQPQLAKAGPISRHNAWNNNWFQDSQGI
jgi:hypothetical protein